MIACARPIWRVHWWKNDQELAWAHFNRRFALTSLIAETQPHTSPAALTCLHPSRASLYCGGRNYEGDGGIGDGGVQAAQPCAGGPLGRGLPGARGQDIAAGRPHGASIAGAATHSELGLGTGSPEGGGRAWDGSLSQRHRGQSHTAPSPARPARMLGARMKRPMRCDRRRPSDERMTRCPVIVPAPLARSRPTPSTMAPSEQQTLHCWGEPGGAVGLGDHPTTSDAHQGGRERLIHVGVGRFTLCQSEMAAWLVEGPLQGAPS